GHGGRRRGWGRGARRARREDGLAPLEAGPGEHERDRGQRDGGPRHVAPADAIAQRRRLVIRSHAKAERARAGFSPLAMVRGRPGTLAARLWPPRAPAPLSRESRSNAAPSAKSLRGEATDRRSGP